MFESGLVVKKPMTHRHMTTSKKFNNLIFRRKKKITEISVDVKKIFIF